MRELSKVLLDYGWIATEESFMLINSEGYILIADTGSWFILESPKGERIWDYPILEKNHLWLVNTINRDCNRHFNNDTNKILL